MKRTTKRQPEKPATPATIAAADDLVREASLPMTVYFCRDEHGEAWHHIANSYWHESSSAKSLTVYPQVTRLGDNYFPPPGYVSQYR